MSWKPTELGFLSLPICFDQSCCWRRRSVNVLLVNKPCLILHLLSICILWWNISVGNRVQPCHSQLLVPGPGSVPSCPWSSATTYTRTAWSKIKLSLDTFAHQMPEQVFNNQGSITKESRAMVLKLHKLQGMLNLCLVFNHSICGSALVQRCKEGWPGCSRWTK